MLVIEYKFAFVYWGGGGGKERRESVCDLFRSPTDDTTLGRNKKAGNKTYKNDTNV